MSKNMWNNKHYQAKREWLDKKRGINESQTRNHKKEKEKERDLIQKQTKEFLKNGGTIKEIPSGVTGNKDVKLTDNQLKRGGIKKSAKT